MEGLGFREMSRPMSSCRRVPMGLEYRLTVRARPVGLGHGDLEG